MNDLISPRIRSYFRDRAAGSTLGGINRDWRSEGFSPSGRGRQEQGERRTAWRDYEEAVDWSNPEQVRRAIRVFESSIVHDDQEELAKHSAVLVQDGWELDAARRIVRCGGRFAELSGLGGLRDKSGILDSFERAAMMLDANPGGCIGAAKDLIEATAKTVLENSDGAWAESDDVPDLVARVQKLLALHPSTVGSAGEMGEATKRILGGLSSIALGVNLLRNRVGGGHGRSTAPKLTQRHARLALGAAMTWCELVLETHSDPEAPWRSQPDRVA